MNQKHRKRIWPYFLAVLILFVLSVQAPREWCTLATTTVSEMEARMKGHLAREKLAEALVRTAGETATADSASAVADGSRLPAYAASAATEHQPVEATVTERVTAVAPELAADRAAIADTRSPEGALGAGAASPSMEPQPVSASVRDVRPLDRYAVAREVVEIEPPVSSQFISVQEEEALAAERLATRPLPTTPASNPRRLQVSDSIPHPAEAASPLQRQTTSADLAAHWPYPSALAVAVSALGELPAYRIWSDAVLGCLQQLSTIQSLNSPEVGSVLKRLESLAEEAKSRGGQETEPATRAQLLRAAHAVTRRLRVWEQIHAVASQPLAANHTSPAADLPAAVKALDSKLLKTDRNGGWREYLLLGEAQRCFVDGAIADTAACRALAKRILLRLEPVALSASQRRFLEQPEVVDFVSGLKPLAIEPLDYFWLLRAIEKHEHAPSAGTGLHIAAAAQTLRWSSCPATVELGQRIDTHYRNANVRVEVSQELVNRLLPAATAVRENVNDTILGARTLGRSSGKSRLRAELIPSPRSWRLALTAAGRLSSQTYSSSGPATFYNRGTAVFRAEKEIIVTPDGIRHESATAGADSNTGLRRVETDFDPLPLFGNLAQAFAKREYENRSGEARAEIDNKIAWRAGRRLDREVGQRIDEVERRLDQELYRPLKKLSLNPAVADMQTTSEALIARARLAGFHQLSAYTPRPKSPADSVLSVQVHESALNNVIEQFGWAGRRANAIELHAELAKLLQRPQTQLPEDFPDDVVLEFAKESPVRIALRDGRVTITLELQELAQGKNRWRDFVVRVHYRPAPEQPDVDLVRDQYVELIGKLGFREQVALRGIFSRVFNRSQPINLITKALRSDPRLEGLVVSQLVIDDGWVGVAIGSAPAERVTGREGPARR